MHSLISKTFPRSHFTRQQGKARDTESYHIIQACVQMSVFEFTSLGTVHQGLFLYLKSGNLICTPHIHTPHIMVSHHRITAIDILVQKEETKGIQ